MEMFSFLSNVVIEEVTTAKPARTGGNSPKQRNPAPEFMGFRIWANGAVFPSAAMVAKFDLEYPQASVSIENDKKTFNVVGNQGNGLDIIDTRQWGQIKTDQDFIAIAISPKNSPKLDLFGITRYNDEGNPVVSVMNQGSTTFGEKTLLPLIKELYNVEPNEEGFIDMKIGTEENGGRNLRRENGIALLPKVISRGVDIGKPDYTRRENVDIYGIAPVQETTTLAEETPAEAAAPEENKAQLTLEFDELNA